KGSQKADEYIRIIKDKLEVAVSQCIEAAGHEIDSAKQEPLLKAAAFGKCFLTDYSPEAYVNMCQMLRVLNQVRNHVIGIPLTYSQLQHLTMPILIDRLVLRKLFYYAVKICQYLKIPDGEGASRILAHWACYKVQQKTEDDEAIARAINQKLGDTPGISYSDIASHALEVGRTDLAIRLLDFEPRAAQQVPLLMKMQRDSIALSKAIESGDTDLVYTVLLRLKESMNQGEFFMSIRSMPIAYALFIQYCRQQNRRLWKISSTRKITFRSWDLQGHQ
ncbi:vacuolar protein sorting-associated protein 16 homolog, partial [Saccostrea cucullata]|uniref:vacuolar protein sorting-associated protein 16 homolog n=1 Tax=Saccostrea cuccullata TaxID=36930 RepID=UPI002ED1D8A6